MGQVEKDPAQKGRREARSSRRGLTVIPPRGGWSFKIRFCARSESKRYFIFRGYQPVPGVDGASLLLFHRTISPEAPWFLMRSSSCSVLTGGRDFSHLKDSRPAVELPWPWFSRRFGNPWWTDRGRTREPAPRTRRPIGLPRRARSTSFPQKSSSRSSGCLDRGTPRGRAPCAGLGGS